jgi:aspartate aminotransferase
MARVASARRLFDVRPSPSLMRFRALRQSSEKIFDFSSKFDTPAHVKAAAARYLETPAASLYGDTRGIPELRAAISRKLSRENGLSIDADREITVAPGGKQGILSVLLALVDVGDEVLLEDPGWLSFEPMVRISGATPVAVPLDSGQDFRLDVDELQRRITPRSRVLILCNPHNPTGRIFNREELTAIAAVVQEHDLIAIVDEAYEHFLYDGHRHISMATIPGMQGRTITVQTASKTFNMFGWRVGWVIAPPALSEMIQVIAGHSFTCVTSFAQAGAAAALDGTIVQGSLTLAELVARYQAQRDRMVAGLREIPGVTCSLPRGAYFAFPNLSCFNLSSRALSERLLSGARVSAIGGSEFGAGGEGHLRFVFNAPLTEINAGLHELHSFFRRL